MKIHIVTPRLVLHDLSVSDAKEMFEYRKDSGVRKFQSFRPSDLATVENFINTYSAGFNAEGAWFQIGIFLQTELIGDMGIHFLGPENSQCELGYTVSPRHQRKGYGREAVSSIVEYLFLELRKHRIVASLNPENIASRALLESLGFRQEALFRQSILNENVWEDDMVYAMLAEEWFQRSVIPSEPNAEC